MTKAETGLCMGCMGQLEGQQVCPRCGYDANSGYDKSYLAPGTLLGERYIVGRLAHKNGESAQYIGYDNTKKTPVWIHEYFPHTIAQRGENGTVLPQPGNGAQFKALMSDFVDICNEVKRLSITEPVVPIQDVLNENSTVYAVYKDLDVEPLESWLQRQGGTLSLERALKLFLPLLNMLSNIHGHGQIHRGISPYTVYIDGDEKLYLWDFALGATRTANSELQSELFSGYSAPEQYSTSGWQGTWTDVYAIGALLYRTLSGIVPPKSTLVGAQRPLLPLEDLVMGLPKNISLAVAEAMNPSTEQRTQAVTTFTSRLMQSSEANTAVYDTNKIQRARGNGQQQPTRTSSPSTGRTGGRPPKRGGSAKYIFLGLLLTVLVLGGFILVFMRSYYNDFFPSGGQSASSQSGDESGGEDGENSGAASNEVPRFVGLYAAEIEADEQYKGRYEFFQKEEFSEDYPAGVVFDQSPTEGSKVESGTIVLHVSKGPKVVEIPELLGMTEADAKAALNALDPDIKVDTFSRLDRSAEPGTVVGMTPAPGTELDPKRDTVLLFINPEIKVEETTSVAEPSSRSSSSRSSSTWDDESSMISFHE